MGLKPKIRCPPERSEAPAERSRRNRNRKYRQWPQEFFTTNPKPPTGNQTNERLSCCTLMVRGGNAYLVCCCCLREWGSFDSARLAPRCAQEDSEGQAQRPRRRRSSLFCVCSVRLFVNKSSKNTTAEPEGLPRISGFVNRLVAPPSRRASGRRLPRHCRPAFYFAPNARTRAERRDL